MDKKNRKNNIVSLATMQSHFSEYVNKINNGTDLMIVTKNGSPVVGVIDYEELCSLYETLDILSEKGAIEDIERAEQEIKDGNYVTSEELKEQILKEKNTTNV